MSGGNTILLTKTNTASTCPAWNRQPNMVRAFSDEVSPRMRVFAGPYADGIPRYRFTNTRPCQHGATVTVFPREIYRAPKSWAEQTKLSTAAISPLSSCRRKCVPRFEIKLVVTNHRPRNHRDSSTYFRYAWAICPTSLAQPISMAP